MTAKLNCLWQLCWPLRDQWQFKGANLSVATNAVLVLTNVLESQAGDCSLKFTLSDPAATIEPCRFCQGSGGAVKKVSG